MHGYNMHYPSNNEQKEKRDMENVPQSEKLFVERQLRGFDNAVEIRHDMQARSPEVSAPFAPGPVL